MAERALVLVGTALHGGGPAEVCVARSPGPIVWAQGDAEAPLSEMRATRTDRGVRIEGPGGRVSIDSAEHMLAALGGLGVRDGVRIQVDGGELPLLDGGARLFCEALFAIGAVCGRPSSLVIARQATLAHGSSRYVLSPPPPDVPASAMGVRLEVDVSFPAPVGRESASFHGDPGELFARIAPARTFGWQHEHEALLAQNRARGVELGSVIVFGPDGPIAGCRPNEPGEIARHKLLDLIGDLALYGGPPRGAIEASSPGHTATHAIVAEAIKEGVIVRRPQETSS
jgi:UDP-3-O-[3-hydroxymyristoyl] N-acetylglucosamine deacetylase